VYPNAYNNLIQPNDIEMKRVLTISSLALQNVNKQTFKSCQHTYSSINDVQWIQIRHRNFHQSRLITYGDMSIVLK